MRDESKRPSLDDELASYGFRLRPRAAGVLECRACDKAWRVPPEFGTSRFLPIERRGFLGEHQASHTKGGRRRNLAVYLRGTRVWRLPNFVLSDYAHALHELSEGACAECRAADPEDDSRWDCCCVFAETGRRSWAAAQVELSRGFAVDTGDGELPRHQQALANMEREIERSCQSLLKALEHGGFAQAEMPGWGYASASAKRRPDGSIEVHTYHLEGEWQTEILATPREVIEYLYFDRSTYAYDAGEWYANDDVGLVASGEDSEPAGAGQPS